ncbi:MAG: outer membrane beta-barrel protein [Bacteroidales bacterium]
MKNLLLIILLLGTAALHAQIPTKSRWNIGADIGTAFNHMATKDLSLKKGHWGITAGLTANYTFKNNIYCESGIRLTDKGSDELTGFDPQLKPFVVSLTLNRLKYLEIPVMAGYRFKLSNAISIIPKVGAYYAIGLNGWGFIKNAGHSFGGRIDPFKDNPFILGDGSKYTFLPYERVDGGFLLGADISFGQAVCRVTYGKSFSPIANSYDSSNKHQTLSVSLGYYLFKKK